MNTNKVAIIIGAGPAGLTAAYQMLKETDIHPIILEETNEIGGISRTVNYNGNRMDLGGHRFFSKDDSVMNLWTTLMPVQGADAKDDKLLGRVKPLEKSGPDPEKVDKVMLVRTRVSRIFYLKKFFDYPISMKPQTFINMGLFRTVSAGFGYIGSAIFKKKEVSLRDFMVNRFGTPLYKMFFEDYTEKLWGKNPKDISASWGAQRIKGLSLSKAIFAVLKKPFMKKDSISQKNVETSLIEQFLYPKKGPGQLWEELAAEVQKLGGEIILNAKVDGLKTENNTISQVVYQTETETKTIDSDIVISTMPIKDLIVSMGDVPPQNVKDIAVNLPYRDFITVGLLVKKLDIENTTKMKTVNNIVPDCWIYIQERNVKLGRLQIFNNWSPYMVKDNEQTVWIGLEYFCDEGDYMWNMSDKEFIDFAVEELCKINIIKKEYVLDGTRLKVKKAYPAYFGTYEQFDVVKDYLDTYSNLYCIGRNGQHRYNNMDHSMVTAMEAVKAIKQGNPDRTHIWNVNTEEEYHEEKQG